MLQPQTRRGYTQAEPQGGAISLPQSDCHLVFHHPQSLPRSAHPDLVINVGPEPPAADLASRIPREDQQDAENSTSRILREDQQDTDISTSRIPCEDLPPVILETPSGSPDLEEELP